MPCPIGLALAKVDARRWLTRAELASLMEEARQVLSSDLSRPLTTREVAQKVGLSEHHFIRSFAHQYGKPPRDYRAFARMREAKRLIEETQQSVSDVAVQVGFGSASSFSRQFRLCFGRSPSQARAEASGVDDMMKGSA